MYFLEEYPRLHSTVMKTQTTLIKGKWDDYDRANDCSAILFLLNSLEDHFQKRLSDKIKDDYTFAKTFLVFVELMRPLSTNSTLSKNRSLQLIRETLKEKTSLN